MLHRQELKDSISATSRPYLKAPARCTETPRCLTQASLLQPAFLDALPTLTPWQIVFYRVGNRCARRGLADPKCKPCSAVTHPSTSCQPQTVPKITNPWRGCEGPLALLRGKERSFRTRQPRGDGPPWIVPSARSSLGRGAPSPPIASSGCKKPLPKTCPANRGVLRAAGRD